MKLLFLIVIFTIFSYHNASIFGGRSSYENIVSAMNETVFAGSLTDEQSIHALQWIRHVDNCLTNFTANTLNVLADGALMWNHFMGEFFNLIHELTTGPHQKEPSHAFVSFMKDRIVTLCADHYDTVGSICHSEKCDVDHLDTNENGPMLHKCLDALLVRVKGWDNDK